MRDHRTGSDLSGRENSGKGAGTSSCRISTSLQMLEGAPGQDCRQILHITHTSKRDANPKACHNIEQSASANECLPDDRSKAS